MTAEARPRRAARYPLDSAVGRLTPAERMARHQSLLDAIASGRITAEHGV